VKWANVISILSLALSGGIFLLAGTGLTSAKDSSSAPVTVVGADGGRALLDTLLPAGEIGLIVIAEGREKRDTVKKEAGNAASEPVTSKPASPSSAESPCININTAVEAELITIKGIGPVTAAKIIEYRAQKGKFRKKEDILKVKGIGPAKFAQMEGRICL